MSKKNITSNKPKEQSKQIAPKVVLKTITMGKLSFYKIDNLKSSPNAQTKLLGNDLKITIRDFLPFKNLVQYVTYIFKDFATYRKIS